MPQKQLSSEAQRRLSAIREYTEFGSGFHIAMRDLDIRGAGNVLGAQQHGHMEAVGYDLYLRLLSQAVANEKDQNDDAPEEDGCLIDVAIDAHIPEDYVDSVKNRIYLYKRIAAVRTQEDVMDVIDECIDRFGEPPESVRGLCEVALIRARATALGVTEISQRGTSLLLFLDEIRPACVSMLATLMKGRIMVSGGKRPYLSVRMLDEGATAVLTRVLKIMEAAKIEQKED